MSETSLKIAYLHPDRPFTNALFAALRTEFADHGLLSWIAGGPAPATDLDVLLVTGSVRREQMAEQPKLALIHTASAGFEGVDLDAATDLGIWVSYCPAADTGNAISVAELAVMLMLGAARRLNETLASVRDRSIELRLPYPALYGKTACIVGLGGIGGMLADRLRAFGMKLVATDQHPERAPQDIRCSPPERLHEAVAEADYVVLCVPASKANENLADAAFFASMKSGAILINIARGALVDENALVAAVTSGHIAAAGLDVLKTEPADPANPLLALPQVLVTPHIAGASDVMLRGTVAYLRGAIDDFAAGRMPKATLNNPARPRRAL